MYLRTNLRKTITAEVQDLIDMSFISDITSLLDILNTSEGDGGVFGEDLKSKIQSKFGGFIEVILRHAEELEDNEFLQDVGLFG